jgi:hypothetical protein
MCCDVFDMEDHTPTRFTGPNTCAHVFGGSCLRMWLRSYNAGCECMSDLPTTVVSPVSSIEPQRNSTRGSKADPTR